MKTIEMTSDYLYRVRSRGGTLVTISYKSGVTYKKVPEAAVRKIVGVGAGRIVDERS